jgi:hypothetical protein
VDLSGVTRFEVIDHTAGEKLDERGFPAYHQPGRALVRYGVSVSLDLQDGGRTLKVFLTDSPVSAELVRQQMADGWRSPEAAE